ncbi:GcrA family cell cycle regulator [Sandaracinobacteroides hominis]|uniref:GcrA family cell cycle regulator n=1 Tax=Sandaracinobacteroides hominis TaxID=2780086 RepID=UPI0018F74167|nr:GcrA family cell cycle regulator [Sandaracinobacteroides hominis]
MAWTDERIAQLKQYWEEGRSASQIAELLGEGLSRNAVIGKAHRLGLASRPSPLKTGEPKSSEPKAAAPKAEPRVAAPRPAPAPRVAEAPAVAPAPAAVAAPVSAPMSSAVPVMPAPRAAPRAKGARVTLLDLNDRICKWPIGHPDEADFHFCGKPVNPGFPYCGEHCLVAYQAQMPRRDRPAGPPRPFGPNLPRPR